MYVCMYAHMYVCMYVCTYVRMYACIYRNGGMYAHSGTHMYVFNVYVYAHYIYMYIAFSPHTLHT